MEKMERGVQRWVVDISKWDPPSDLFSFLVSILPQHEHSPITRFVKMEDRKRALVSRLLQYALVHQLLGIPFHQIAINRTAEGKPYLVCENMNLEFPNFNFNASHHGDYVAVASEPICLVGLDIISHSVPKNETVSEYIQNFCSCFSHLEWQHIIHAGSPDDMLQVFCRYWCLKEAYVKAIGSGVAHKLDGVEFHHTDWKNIFVKVAGKELKDWKFWLLHLGQNHSVAISRGHPRNAILSYRRTLQQAEMNDEEYRVGLNLPNPSFTFSSVEDLIPVLQREIGMTLCVSSIQSMCADEDEERARSTSC